MKSHKATVNKNTYYLFLSKFFNLTKTETSLIDLLISTNNQLNDKQFINNIISNKDIAISSMQSYRNILSSLRKKKVIINNELNELYQTPSQLIIECNE